MIVIRLVDNLPTLGNKYLVPAYTTVREDLDNKFCGCSVRRNWKYELRSNPKPKKLVAKYGVSGKIFSDGSIDEDCWFNWF